MIHDGFRSLKGEVSMKRIAMKKTAADLNFSETLARAESEARGKAVLSLANALTAHLAEDVK
jgi:hypothetical protein